MTRIVTLTALLLLGCNLEVVPEYTIPFEGTVDVISGGNQLLDAGDEEEALEGFLVLSITPDEGAPDGGDKLTIMGNELLQGDRVFFGEVESDDVRFHGDQRLVVITPPHTPGVVDVRVVHPLGEEVHVEDGFLYSRRPTLLSVDPARADARGGTPCTLSFRDITPGARVLVGGRLLASGAWGDEQTFLGVLPTLAPGWHDVLVVDPGRTWRFEDALLAVSPPQITRLEPPVLQAASGGPMEIVGAGLVPGTRVLVDGIEQAVIYASPDGRRLGLHLSPGDPGDRALDVIAPGGTVRVLGALSLLGASAAPAIRTVTPSSGPAVGGARVQLGLAGLAPQAVLGVRVCDEDAPITARGGAWLQVTLPALPAGACPVEARTADGVLPAPLDFEVRAPAFEIEDLSPTELSAAGGDALRVRGQLPAGLDQVRICGVPGATPVRDGEDWVVLAPPGSPGPCPVELVTAGAREDSGWRVELRAGRAELFGVLPPSGAQAGDTLVEVIGTDLDAALRVEIGGLEAPLVAAGSTALSVRTPKAVGAGPAAVQVDLDGVSARRPRAFSYYDPYGGENGTSGGPIDGALNLTVVHSTTRAPVQGAHVAVARDHGAWWRGYTDERGQVIFSEPGLSGPVSVTASRDGFTAYSIVDVDARDVALPIFTPIPQEPSTDEPTPPPEIHPASISGRLIGVDKYVPPAIGACPVDAESGLCLPCQTDQDCRADLACAPVGDQGGRCVLDCGDDPEVCPERFACLGSTDGARRCLPLAGAPASYCYPTLSMAYPTPSELEPRFGVDPVTHEFLLDTVRLGELAVVCLAGYHEWRDGHFVSRRMGLARHLFTISGQHVSDVEVLMDIVLGDSPPFRVTGFVDRPQAFASLDAITVLDLGSDGAIAFPDMGRFESSTRVVFPGVPSTLEGALYDASYVVQVHADRGSDYTPYAEASLYDVDGFEQTRFYRFEDGAPIATTLSIPLDFTGATTDEAGGALAVTRDGRVLRAAYGTWYAEPVQSPAPLRGITARGDLVVAVGDGGALLMRHAGQWALPTSVGERALEAAWIEPDGGLVLVGDHRLYEGSSGDWREDKIAARLTDVVGDGADATWAVGHGGVVLRRGPGEPFSPLPRPTDADLFVVAPWPGGGAAVGGADGVLLRLDPDGQATSLDPDATLQGDLRALAWDGDQLWIGLDGGLARWSAAELSWPLEDTHMRFEGLVVDDEGLALAVGGMALSIGPIQPPVTFQSPRRLGSWGGRTLAWTLPGPLIRASYHYVTLHDYFGELVWTVMLSGDAAQVTLPPLDAWGMLDPLARPALRLQFNRVIVDGFDIDAYASYSSASARREAKLFDYFEFMR